MMERKEDTEFQMRTGERLVFENTTLESIDCVRHLAAQHTYQGDFTEEELKDLAEARRAKDMNIFLKKHPGVTYRMYEIKCFFFKEYGELEAKHARVSYPKGESFTGAVSLELFDPYLSSEISSN